MTRERSEPCPRRSTHRETDRHAFRGRRPIAPGAKRTGVGLSVGLAMLGIIAGTIGLFMVGVVALAVSSLLLGAAIISVAVDVDVASRGRA